MSFADVDEHGTPEGFRQGCRGRGGCDPAQPWTCEDAMRRWRGDLTYRRRVEAGMSPAEIAAAEVVDARADRAHLAAVARAERRPRKAAKVPRGERPARVQELRDLTGVAGVAEVEARALAAAAGLGSRHASRPSYGADAHGTTAGYGRGCRAGAECPSAAAGGISCVEAHRVYMRAYQKARRALPVPAEHHGTRYGYALGCRRECPASPSCSDARLEYVRARRQARRTA